MPRKASLMLELLPAAASFEATVNDDGYRPFPVEALPAPLDAFVGDGAKALGCDAACLALPVLAVVASAIGNSRTIRLKEGWEEPCVIWSAIVGQGGTVPAAAIRKALAPLVALQQSLCAEYTSRWDWYELARKEQLDAHRQAVNIWGMPPGEEPQRPILQRVMCGFTTPEKLAAILEQNPRGLLVAREELNGWLASYLRTRSAGGERDPSFWLEAHRAGPIHVERGWREPGLRFIPRPAVSITGAMSPGLLSRALRSEVSGSGLVGCFLLASPPQLPKVWSADVIENGTEGAFHGLLERLLRLKMDERTRERERTPERVPHVLTLSPEALAAWVTFYDGRDAESDASAVVLAAALGRMEAYAARLALIHHVVHGVYREENDLMAVGSESIKAGVTLCRWFTAEMKRIYAKMAESADLRNAVWLVQSIRQCGGRVRVRELMRRHRHRYPNVATARDALGKLVALGLAQWTKAEVAAKCRQTA